MYKHLIIFFALIWNAFCVETNKQNLNILVSCDVSTKSHVKGIFEIGENLVNSGHKMTFASFETNGGYTKGYNISSVLFEGGLTGELNLENLFVDVGELNIDKINELFNTRYPKMLSYSYKKLFPSLEELVTTNHYDLMICDSMSNVCQDVAQKHGIPLIIGVLTLDSVFDYFPKYKPHTLSYSAITTEKMGFLERYYFKVIHQISVLRHFSEFFKVLKEQRAMFNVKDRGSLFGNYNYGFGLANTFIGFEVAQQLPQNIQLIGPIMSKNNQDLTKELEDFLNDHPRTIYIAFGSAAVLDHNTMTSILRSISSAIDKKIIDGVIWGLGKSEKTLRLLPEKIQYEQSVIITSQLIQNQHPNIKLLKWAPQPALLNHPNIKLFVSHGGLESTFESAHSKTPILCIPILADQPRNAAKIEYMGIGTYLSFKDISNDPIHMINQIRKIVEDKNDYFKMNLSRISMLTQGTELRKKLAAKLIEDYVYTSKLCRKHKPYDPQGDAPPCELEPLLPPTWKIDFNRLYSIDIIIVNLLLLSLIMYIVYFALKYIIIMIYNMMISKDINNSKKSD